MKRPFLTLIATIYTLLAFAVVIYATVSPIHTADRNVPSKTIGSGKSSLGN